MLQAILLNKAGRNLSSTEIHWSQLFKTSEDSLTSTIFGTLLYLPREQFWQVLIKACYGEAIPFAPAKIESVEFWPHWNADQCSNANYVEPDVFIRTADYDLIIEAKRFDHKQQSRGQWENEIVSYLNDYGADNRKVYLLAIGGLHTENKELMEVQGKQVEVIKCRWIRILNEVKFLKAEIEKNPNKFPNYGSIISVLSDLILGFRLHGYVTGEWFEKTNFSTVSLIRNSSIKQFINPLDIESWKNQLRHQQA